MYLSYWFVFQLVNRPSVVDEKSPSFEMQLGNCYRPVRDTESWTEFYRTHELVRCVTLRRKCPDQTAGGTTVVKKRTL